MVKWEGVDAAVQMCNAMKEGKTGNNAPVYQFN